MKGRRILLSQHGFARDREFTLVSQTDEEAWFALESDETTRECYPFDFRLELGYRLSGREVEVLWRVKNTGKETMYFSIGGHPAFACPLNEEGNKEGYSFWFDSGEPLETRIIGPDGLATDDHEEYFLDEGTLPITEELFDQDALVVGGRTGP